MPPLLCPALLSTSAAMATHPPTSTPYQRRLVLGDSSRSGDVRRHPKKIYQHLAIRLNHQFAR